LEDPEKRIERRREKRRTKTEEKKKKEKRKTKQRGCIQKIDTHKNGLVVAPSAIQTKTAHFEPFQFSRPASRTYMNCLNMRRGLALY